MRRLLLHQLKHGQGAPEQRHLSADAAVRHSLAPPPRDQHCPRGEPRRRKGRRPPYNRLSGLCQVCASSGP